MSISDSYLASPAIFTSEFFKIANSEAPPSTAPTPWTQWFERVMLKLGQKHGIYCQNLQTICPSGHNEEWMEVDHVFLRTNRYDNFPLIVVEHENGGMCDETLRGEIPRGDAVGAFFEWAAWKSLAMMSELHVLVGYPHPKYKTEVFALLNSMVQGWARQFGHLPNALFLLGWWSTDSTSLPVPWMAERLFDPYVVEKSDKGAVQLISL